jgi:hypothetical protein
MRLKLPSSRRTINLHSRRLYEVVELHSHLRESSMQVIQLYMTWWASFSFLERGIGGWNIAWAYLSFLEHWIALVLSFHQTLGILQSKVTSHFNNSLALCLFCLIHSFSLEPFIYIPCVVIRSSHTHMVMVGGEVVPRALAWPIFFVLFY